MGRVITLTGTTITNPDAPRLIEVDPIESAGSLLLIDPTHPAGAWDAGVPANGATVQNLLGGTLGVGDATVQIAGGIANGTKGKLERSTRGGMHGIVSQANLLTTDDGCRVYPAQALIDYIYANKSHVYYVSFWDRLTRTFQDSGQPPVDYALGAATPTQYALALAAASQAWTPTIVGRPGSRLVPATVGPRFSNVAQAPGADFSSGLSGSGLPIWGAVNSGTYNGQVIGTRNNDWTSFVFYRVYLEDLTVSGRTYAEVDAIDYALYTKEVLTAGGRYEGDTYTDPATIP